MAATRPCFDAERQRERLQNLNEGHHLKHESDRHVVLKKMVRPSKEKERRINVLD